MNFEQYQTQAVGFVAFPEEQPFSYLLPALAEEVGELQGIFAKNFRKYGHYNLSTEQKDNVRSELGDVLWNVAMLSEFIGYTLKWIAEENIMKLQNRKEKNEIATIQRRES